MSEDLWALPPGWHWARFGDVAQVDSDLVDPRLTPDLPHIAPNHMERDTGVLLTYGTVAGDAVTSAKHRFRPGHIIYSKIRPYLAKAVMVDFEGLCSADCYPISTSLDASYLHRWLVSPHFTAQAAGAEGRTLLPKINKTELAELQVPVAPAALQPVIARELEVQLGRTRRARGSLATVPNLLEKLRKAVLAAAFRGDLTASWREANPAIEPASVLLERIRAERRSRWEAANPRKSYVAPEPVDPEADGLPELPVGWVWARLEELIDGFDAGRSPRSEGRPAGPAEFGVLKVSAVTWVEFDPSANKAMLASDIPEDGTTVRAGDLLISRANTYQLVGAVVLVQDDYPRLMLSDKTLRLRYLPTVDPSWLLYGLRTKEVRDLFEGDASGTSDSMRNLSQPKIGSAPIALAPAGEQAEITAILRSRFASLEVVGRQARAQLADIARLERSILSRAFRGELLDPEPSP